MRASFPIARVLGIPIRLHATFFLLPLLAAVANLGEGGVTGALRAALLVPILFVFVVLHELGHSVVALWFGLRIRDITLLPIGGVARMEDPPRTPGQEILIAVAGPCVNLTIAACFLLVLIALGIAGAPFDPAAPGLLATGLATNVGLGLFNLFPAFPMDGGRVLRGLLAWVLGFHRATRVAAVVGQAFGLLGMATGLIRPGLFVLAIIGFFVFLAAGQELRASRVGLALGRFTAGDAMVRRFERVSPASPLGELAALAASSFQADFPVVSEERLLGLLSRADVDRALRTHPPSTPIGELSSRPFLATSPEARLSDLYTEMLRRGSAAAAVVEKGRLEGIVTLDRIASLMVKGTAEEA